MIVITKYGEIRFEKVKFIFEDLEKKLGYHKNTNKNIDALFDMTLKEMEDIAIRKVLEKERLSLRQPSV